MEFTHENFLLVCDGKKTTTSRRPQTYKYYSRMEGTRTWAVDSETGKKAAIIIKSVYLIPLGQVKNEYYMDEGYESPEKFYEVWCKIYGEKNWNAGGLVTVVRFELCASPSHPK